MKKIEKLLRAYFYQRVRGFLIEKGGSVLAEKAGDRESRPSTEFIIMTDAGRLKIHLSDDSVMTAFDRPKKAVEIGVNCNPHSGKWNFHTFIGQEKVVSKEWIDPFIEGFFHAMTSVNARPMKYTQTSITISEYEEVGIETLRDRIAFGERIEISDFDRESAKAWYIATVTDDEGKQPDWLVDSARRHMNSKSDVEVLATLRGWIESWPETHVFDHQILRSFYRSIPAKLRQPASSRQAFITMCP